MPMRLPQLILLCLLGASACRPRAEETEGARELRPKADPLQAELPAQALPAAQAVTRPGSPGQQQAQAGQQEARRTVIWSGKDLREAIARGELGKKGTLVNAWASWCGPCRAELPMLLKLKDDWAARGVELVLVSVDEPDTETEPRALLDALGFRGPLFIARPPLSSFKAELHPGWPGMLPATFLFGPRGELLYFWGGPVLEEEVKTQVERLLHGEKVQGEMRYGLIPGRDYRKDEPQP